ncbi:MAG: hypothetical protein QOF89_2840 [Acidobacteriota bacterium]|nr:hypothetical protein [Acidobacteriota bacterium]
MLMCGNKRSQLPSWLTPVASPSRTLYRTPP